ncbi:hypothetical protein BpHYR1_049387 [Brachionus plicatilis]|uniref:Uncharacterized protein n=1 Tax=Brachionus plicatilis TaxID=10195 RepID=A0A3M7REA9_BRAPC|nr:hypothetical protein BpHYR1_049387 [Brachionus plicatilis]
MESLEFPKHDMADEDLMANVYVVESVECVFVVFYEPKRHASQKWIGTLVIQNFANFDGVIETIGEQKKSSCMLKSLFTQKNKSVFEGGCLPLWFVEVVLEKIGHSRVLACFEQGAQDALFSHCQIEQSRVERIVVLLIAIFCHSFD